MEVATDVSSLPTPNNNNNNINNISAHNNNNNINVNLIGSAKSPDPDVDTPTGIQSSPNKPLPFTNGVLKRHLPHRRNNHRHIPVVVTYKECLKNHAATLGGHALDGCGEFMTSPSVNPSDPTSLKCAACGCHRNFHRREPEDSTQPSSYLHHPQLLPPPLPPPTTEYQPHHRHHPLPPLRGESPASPASPPPISSSYYPSSAPRMLLALSTAPPGQPAGPGSINHSLNKMSNGGGRKRFRTKFSPVQKEKMWQFAERVGWKMQRRDEQILAEFCNEVGVDRGVFKVWMHNNKNTFGKRNNIDNNLNNESSNGGGGIDIQKSLENGSNENLVHLHIHDQQMQQQQNSEGEGISGHIGTNGSSSSS